MSTAFITGATGFLGSHFLLHIEKKSYEKIILLVRGSDECRRKSKLFDALKTAASSYRENFCIESIMSKVVCINGDITQKKCGIDGRDMLILKNESDVEIWHFAASISFENEAEQLLQKQNVGGALNVLELACDLDILHFYYVSTAYTSGLQDGEILEVLHENDRDFSNHYEKSKLEAERLVYQWCAATKLPLTVFRPSIVIGNSITKKPGGGWSGLYGFIRMINLLRRPLSNTSESVRINGIPSCQPNFVPVDFVVKEMFEISCQNNKENIYHLTSENSVNVGFVCREIAKKLGMNNVYVEDFDLECASPLEELLNEKINIYSAYLKNDRKFIRGRRAKYQISENEMLSYIVEGVRVLRREDVSSVFTLHILQNSPHNLNVYTLGCDSKPPVFLINANGMPADFMVPIAKKLAQFFFVVTWESRLVPSQYSKQELCNEIGFIDNHLLDFEMILDFFRLKKVDVVGWCSGAGIALASTLSNLSSRVGKVVLINGAYEKINNVRPTNFESNIRLIMPKVANDSRYAGVIYNAIFRARNDSDTNEERDASNSTSALLSSTDPDLVHLTSVPFESADNLFKYAHLVDGYMCSFPENIHDCKHNVLVLTGDRDVTTSPGSSRYIASKIKKSTFIEIAGGDHFMHYKMDGCKDVVIRFLRD